MARVIKASLFGDLPPRVIENPSPRADHAASPGDLDSPGEEGVPAAERYEDPFEKAKRDAAEILAAVGKVMADARANAQDYEDSARISAAQIIRDAEAEAAKLTGAADAEKKRVDDVLREAEEREAQAQHAIDDAKAEAERLLADAKAQTEKLVADAKKESADLIEDANQQSSMIREDAKKQGHEEGVAAGRDEGERKIREEQAHIIAEANAKAQQTMGDAKQAAYWYVLSAENQIAQLVLQIADKILPQHFIDAPTIILPLVSEALKKVADQPTVHVHVSPDNYDLVLLARAELQQLLEGNGNLEILTDENLGAGDVVIDTPNGNVDATLETQLSAIHVAVEKTLNKL